MIAALLLGRKGSIGFPGKNDYPVLGRPMAIYPMRAAMAAQVVDCAYLSTDDRVLMDLARVEGLKVIERPPHLATKQALGEEAYRHGYEVIREMARARGESIELMVLLFCNAPTVTAAMVERGVDVLREHPDYDSAVTASCYNMWSPLRARRVDSDGLLQPFVPLETLGDTRMLNCDRDSQGDAWFADMGLSIVRPRCLENLDEGLLPQKWMGQRIYPLKQWGGLDVDFEWQIPLVEYWLRAHGVEPRAPAPAAANQSNVR